MYKYVKLCINTVIHNIFLFHIFLRYFQVDKKTIGSGSTFFVGLDILHLTTMMVNGQIGNDRKIV